MKKKHNTPDLWLMGGITFLLTIGLIMVYSASSVTSFIEYNGSSGHFFFRQLIWAVMGVFIMIILAIIDYAFYEKMAWPVCIGMGLLLVVVAIPGVGQVHGGSSRWLNVGFTDIQPSELAKIAVVLVVSACSAKIEGKNLKNLKSYWKPLLAAFVLAILIFIEPDLGGSATVASLAFLIVFAAGVRIMDLLVPCAMLLPVVFMKLHSYQMDRITSVMNPWSDPLGNGYHTIQSLIALGSGGMFGHGIGNSRQKFLYLPEQHTDFIFSIIGEELGFVGTMLVLALFMLLIWRGYKIAISASDKFGTFTAFGLTALIAMQSIYNIGMTTGVFPIKGLALPFISYGGSSMLMIFVCAGILLSISRGHAVVLKAGDRA